MRLVKLLIFLFVFVLLGTLNAGAKGLFGAGEFYLNNGMRVIVIENHRVPIVKHMLWYKNGASAEKLGKGGIAHLLEHLMFRGTYKVSGDSFNQIMEENGAESNAFTGMDVTVYHQLLDISRLELAMFLEADRMKNLKIDDDNFAKEQAIVFEERKQMVDNNPLARFGEVINRTLWQNHSYARPIIGTDSEILALTSKDAMDFYQQFYAPNNAVLVLSGDINLKEAKELANKYYGKLKKTQIKKIETVSLNNAFRAEVEVAEKEVNSVRIIKRYATASLNKDSNYVYPLQVLASYMGGGETSKLFKKLVLQDKKALAVAVNYNPVTQSYGNFQISLTPAEGVSISEAKEMLSKAWDEALTELNVEELEKVKNKMLAGLIYLRDNPEDAAYIVGSMASVGASLEEIELQEDKIKKVRKQQVLDVANLLIDNTPQVLGILKPEKKNNG